MNKEMSFVIRFFKWCQEISINKAFEGSREFLDPFCAEERGILDGSLHVGFTVHVELFQHI